MSGKRMVQALKEMYPSRMITIDSHTAGEPTRLIVGGIDIKFVVVCKGLEHLMKVEGMSLVPGGNDPFPYGK